MYKKVVLVIILSFSLFICGCGNKVDNSKYAVGNKVQYNIDAMEMDSYGDPEVRDRNKNTIYTIKRVIDNGDGTYDYELDKESQQVSEKYLMPAEETETTTETSDNNDTSSNQDDSSNAKESSTSDEETASEKTINIFESQDNWNKYINGDCKNKKVSFEGIIDSDSIKDEKGSLNLYNLSYKASDNGYYKAVIGTIKDEDLKKGDKVKGWGMIISGEKLGAPVITVMSISKE